MLTLKLVRAFANLMVSIDLSDEEAISSQVGSDLLGNTAGLLGDLTAEESAELITLIEQVASMETDPERRDALEALPETMGLIDE